MTYPIMPSDWAPSTSKGYGSTSAYAAACSANRPTCGPLPWKRTSSCLLATAAMAGAADLTFPLRLGCHRLATLEQCIAA